MSNEGIMYEFKEFGKNMQIVAICTILGIGPIALIFMFIALGNIKRANFQLNNNYLKAYRSKIINSFIIGLLGVPILIIGILLIVFSATSYILPFDWMIISSGGAIVGIGAAFFIVSGIINMHAWEGLKLFFAESGEMFPERLRDEAYSGAEKLRMGALMYLLGFLVITLFIGFILQVVGYFKLSKLNMLDLSYTSKPKPQESLPQEVYQEQIPISSEKPKFCPACGARLSGEGRFCALCGSEIA
ncbi:MAG: hypothetical protein ACFFBW_04790 [Promethearchaeota archaeon]